MDAQINGTAPKRAHVIDGRGLLHQAAGMISVQLGVPIPVAIARLQAYATEHGQAVADVAADVVGRRLRFGDQPAD
jgi:hypothetical protein